MSSSPPPPSPPPVDYSGAMIAQADAGARQMAMYVGGQTQQTLMMTNVMNMQGMRDMMLQQDKLDAKLEIATMNYDLRAREEMNRHKESMVELANRHIETLAKHDEIELNSENYDVGYPYQLGTS